MDEVKTRIKHTTESFIKALTETNKNDLDFSKVVFTGTKKKIEITCNVCKTTFHSIAGDVLVKGTGCPACRKENLKTLRIRPTDSIEKEFRSVHGDRYQYDFSTYVSTRVDMKMSCSKHGEFWQTPNNHVWSNGCYKCGRDTSREKRVFSEHEVFEKCRILHNNKYKYIDGSYVSALKKMSIICPKHGVFRQIAQSHMNGMGCSRCFSRVSKPQEELESFVRSLGIDVLAEYKMKSGKYIDIFCPELKIGIELDGCKWHSVKYRNKSYHIDKTIAAQKEGISLIHIFDDEWIFEQEKVKANIKSFLVTEVSEESFNVNSCSKEDAIYFLEKFTLVKGIDRIRETIRFYCLTEKSTGQITAVLSYSEVVNAVVIMEFCSILYYKYAFSKLLPEVLKIGKPIIAMSDERFIHSVVLKENNFEYLEYLEPERWIVSGRKRVKPTYENITSQDLVIKPENTIWDCGKIMWRLENKKA